MGRLGGRGTCCTAFFVTLIPGIEDTAERSSVPQAGGLGSKSLFAISSLSAVCPSARAEVIDTDKCGGLHTSLHCKAGHQVYVGCFLQM